LHYQVAEVRLEGMAASLVNHVCIDAITATQEILHLREREGTGEHCQVDSMDLPQQCDFDWLPGIRVATPTRSLITATGRRS
jgi:hypothetical protein